MTVSSASQASSAEVTNARKAAARARRKSMAAAMESSK
eukprot:CAMPEP_0197648784 /NCGR_PEP_ID=MMETSP1338-20131121/27959_1 /TAXON_ID=43686 ORGANISM="Pelagodinium beii, Strain RCC1491" /NCGR_SAMPLE_ID=MMETSP1338 /ASSEMBLY_ACC=CAM_ASM_000754 /LENGTH=37 /DNA_ID= /DNA_START= /DNA_END= /DNA_ORIENTATION=